jgi:hypothetical protein
MEPGARRGPVAARGDMTAHEEIALRFAQALDREDYASAGECLAAVCEYRIGDDVHRGREAILASYRSSGDWATAHLDGVRYESSVRPGEEGEVVIEFTDHLEHAGQKHTHRCEQHLAFDDSGRIARIRHVDHSGEPEALQRFFEAAGLRRKP